MQEICAPVFAEETGRDLIGIDEVPEIYDYLAKHHISIKFNGIGKSWRPSSDPYLDRDVAGIFDHYAGMTKICCENLVTPAGLNSVLKHQISCWQRGGETEGLGILMVDRDLPLKEKTDLLLPHLLPGRVRRPYAGRRKEALAHDGTPLRLPAGAGGGRA
ncbi:MAG: hypothetical protein L6W00_24325 [Lentisphaeria bacterium]|nr:MAG: hypothetical protein L6W00_24325 [Lentisphaeria bacterium]